MLVLIKSTQSLQVVRANAKTTNEMSIVLSYGSTQNEEATVSVQTSNILTNGTTPVVILGGIGDGTDATYLECTGFIINNTDTVTDTVTIKYVDGSTTLILAGISLPSGYSIIMSRDGDIYVIDGNGSVVQSVGQIASNQTGNITFSGTITFTKPIVYSHSAAVVAHSGGGQQAGSSVTTELINISQVAAIGDSVTLGSLSVGQRVSITNNDVKTATIFGFTGFSIDGGSVNGSINILPQQTIEFICTGATTLVSNRPNAQTNPGIVTTQAVNSTATVTAAQLIKGYVTSTSAAAVTATLDTATNIASALGAVQGSIFDFYVDNSAGANTVTVAVGAGITSAGLLTGQTTLTVASGTTGWFRLIFNSTSAAVLFRMG